MQNTLIKDGLKRLVVVPGTHLIELAVMINEEVVETGKCLTFEEVSGFQDSREIFNKRVFVDPTARMQESVEAVHHYDWCTFNGGINLSPVPPAVDRASGERAEILSSLPTHRCHELKTWPDYFQAMVRGDKPFECRKNDRDYQAGDWLILREWNPEECSYSGRALTREVTYVLRGPGWGIKPEWCVMAVRAI